MYQDFTTVNGWHIIHSHSDSVLAGTATSQVGDEIRKLSSRFSNLIDLAPSDFSPSDAAEAGNAAHPNDAGRPSVTKVNAPLNNPNNPTSVETQSDTSSELSVVDIEDIDEDGEYLYTPKQEQKEYEKRLEYSSGESHWEANDPDDSGIEAPDDLPPRKSFAYGPSRWPSPRQPRNASPKQPQGRQLPQSRQSQPERRSLERPPKSQLAKPHLPWLLPLPVVLDKSKQGP